MEPSQILSGTIFKPVFGAILGLLLGTIVLVFESSFGVNVLAGIVLLLIVLFSGLIDILLGLVLGLILLGVNAHIGVIQRLADSLSIGETVGGDTIGSLSETLFVWFVSIVFGVIVADILLFRVKPDFGPPPQALAGCGVVGGLLLGIGMWGLLAAEVGASPGLIVAWGIVGALLGFVAALIPGPPWD